MIIPLTSTELSNTYLTVEVFEDNLSTTRFRFVALKLEDMLWPLVFKRVYIV